MRKNNAKDIIPVYNEWFEEHGWGGDYFLEAERESIFEIANNFKNFEINGGILYANGKIAAFTMSEKITSDTALIHIEKADPKIRGAYAAINNFHLKEEYADLKYVNREDDSGEIGLRKAKNSYHPEFLYEKYLAHPKADILSEKTASREKAKKIRKALPPREFEFNTKKYKKIFCYISDKYEVSTKEFIEANKDKIWSPKIDGETMKIAKFADDLILNKFNILEPKDFSNDITPEDFDLIIVPALCLDENYNRLGHGGGYYDKFLKKAINAKKIGVCQIELKTDVVPTNSWDVNLDEVIFV
jgi:5,10-methenyltetrahydrofolate synthetase